MAFLESISIARTFGKVFNYRPDEFWESFAIGLSNIIGSYFGSFPVTGSFSRTALNASTGVKTTFGGIITSLVVIIALSFMLPVFHFIPKAALGAIIVCAAAGMFEPIVITHGKRLFGIVMSQFCRFAGIRRMSDEAGKEVSLDGCIACFATFVLCFYGLAVGIIAGLAISIGSILYRVSHPHINCHLKKDDSEHLMIKPTADSLSYSSCNFIHVRMSEILLNYGFDLENDEPVSGAAVLKVNGEKDSGGGGDFGEFNNDENQRLISSNMISLLSQKVNKITVDLTGVRQIDHDALEVFKDFKKNLANLDCNVQFTIKQFCKGAE